MGGVVMKLIETIFLVYFNVNGIAGCRSVRLTQGVNIEDVISTIKNVTNDNTEIDKIISVDNGCSISVYDLVFENGKFKLKIRRDK
jgi:hypothetical protein